MAARTEPQRIGAGVREFVEASRFTGRTGAAPGEPNLPSLAHLALETLKVGAIGVAISLVIALPVGVWLGHRHRGSFIAINLGNVGPAPPGHLGLAVRGAVPGICFAG